MRTLDLYEILLNTSLLYQQIAADVEPRSLATGRLYVVVDEDDGSISVEVELAELRDLEEDWPPSRENEERMNRATFQEGC